ncbi:hypothetical protein [Polycladidibacter stylochi]|uniref:hypothetical protein n=1 Tax=Polycladidibacter stylochi TaxID=1807766 RepID=UPI00082A658E|nr:hypothetical protein [Pseudovibrio stylochi]
MHIKLVHAGFDSIEVAFIGCLPEETLVQLRQAKEAAQQEQQDQSVSLNNGRVRGCVRQTGLKGGYAFLLDTGADGELWSIKDSSNTTEWNLAVKLHASALACMNFEQARRQIYQRLHDLDATFGQESIRRVDFAFDFLLPQSFTLNYQHFVAHYKTKVRPHFEKKTSHKKISQTSEGDSFVFCGRRIESVTLGKMPGRQICVYDKRLEALTKKKPFWFKLWGIDPKDTTKSIWRVELRAGKKELKDNWGLRTFADIEHGIGDVYSEAISTTRYVTPLKGDSNLSRWPNHPLWDAVGIAMQTKLSSYQAGLTRDQLKQTIKEQQKEIYIQQITGNAASLAALLDLSATEIREDFADQIAQTLQNKIDHPDEAFWKSLQRAEKRMGAI